MADVTATSITVGLWNALKSPDQYDYAGGVAGVLDPLVESFAAVVLQAANAATGDASSKLKLADELARQARAWESVTSDIASSIDPANRIDVNRVEVGQQIAKGLRESEGFWRQAANGSLSSAQLSSAAAAAVGKMAGAVGLGVGIAQMADAGVTGGGAAVGEKLAGILASLAASAAAIAAAGLTVPGVGLAVAAGYLFGKLGELAYREGWLPGMKEFFGFLDEIGHWIGQHLPTPYDIEYAVGDFFTRAQRWVFPRDPLTLDLDGDGIETVAVSSTNPILFDHDGDGLKNATGWMKPDDGFLVMDRNGNGTIDNGTELFGDSTNLYGGGKAADGFAALAQEDTNNDGKISSADANFAYLRVWRDLNQNGISESGELATLASLNIASIDIAKKNNSQPLPGGNEIADLGTYTKTDGSTGSVGEVMKLADVNLAVDTFHREFPDTVPLAAGVTALPNMQGSGLVRDLWEAMSQSADLKSLVAQFAGATTKAAQMAIMDQILGAWADTSTSSSRFKPRAPAANARRRQCNPAPRQKPHGMDVCRQSIANSAMPCGSWRGGSGASPIDAIRGGRAAREFGMKSNEVCVLHKQFRFIRLSCGSRRRSIG